MPTYYPQDAADVVLFVTVALCCIIGFAAWIAGLYDSHNPLPPEDDFHLVPAPRRYIVDAEANAAELAQFADMADLARGTSDNLVDDYICPISGLTGAQFKAISKQISSVQL